VGGEVLVEPEEGSDNSAHLSRRELGMSNREIADELQVGVRTIECHRERAQHKTDTRTRAQACAYARELH